MRGSIHSFKFRTKNSNFAAVASAPVFILHHPSLFFDEKLTISAESM